MKSIIVKTTTDVETKKKTDEYLVNNDLDSPKYSPAKSDAKPFAEGIAKAHVRSLTAKHPAEGTYDSINME